MSLAAKVLFVPQRQLAKRRLVDEWHLRGTELDGGKRFSDGKHPDRE